MFNKQAEPTLIVGQIRKYNFFYEEVGDQLISILATSGSIDLKYCQA